MRPGETAAGTRTDSESDLYPLYMQKSAGKATEGCRRCDEMESRQRIIGIYCAHGETKQSRGGGCAEVSRNERKTSLSERNVVIFAVPAGTGIFSADPWF
nr:hypothetical protein [Bacillaceae bacterium]